MPLEPGRRPEQPGGLSRTFRRLSDQAGLPPVRLHDLRHGAATLALAAKVDLKVVQGMLGHASIVLTADTYTNSRELHQLGEKPQVAMSGRVSSGLSVTFCMAA